MEQSRKICDEGRPGESIGALLRGIRRGEILRGQVLAAPGSITFHTRFEAEAYILSEEEGGRSTPFFIGYRPQFRVYTTDVTGSIELPPEMQMVMPGENVNMIVELGASLAIYQGLRFKASMEGS